MSLATMEGNKESMMEKTLPEGGVQTPRMFGGGRCRQRGRSKSYGVGARLAGSCDSEKRNGARAQGTRGGGRDLRGHGGWGRSVSLYGNYRHVSLLCWGWRPLEGLGRRVTGPDATLEGSPRCSVVNKDRGIRGGREKRQQRPGKALLQQLGRQEPGPAWRQEIL